MDVRTIQKAINATDIMPKLEEDDDAGPKTMDAIELFLDLPKATYEDWSDARKLIAAEQVVMRSEGIDPGPIDGLVGPKTKQARAIYDARHPPTEPETGKISKAAFDLIVAEEVSSQAVYTKKYRHPEWPGVQSGVTIGIGYDVGYATPARLRADWSGRIPDAMIDALVPACGVTGERAKTLAVRLRSSVDIPWEAAISVFAKVDVPRWVATVARKLPNTDRLKPDALGALVSLAYNRGPSFDNAGDRYREMRAIKAHMASGAFHKIPAEFRSMKRIWPTVPGLQGRREREARLFEAGLA